MSHVGLKLAAPSSAPRCNLLPAASSRGLISREALQREEILAIASEALSARQRR